MKLGWILSGDRNIGSARILGYNLHDWIKSNTKVQSEIVHSAIPYLGGVNPTLEMNSDTILKIVTSGFNWIIFQKVCAGSAETLVRECKYHGVKTAFILDDLEPVMLPMCKMVDMVIIGDDSTMIGEWVAKQTQHPNIFLLSDAYETPKDFYKKDYKQNGTLKVVWFGNMSHCKEAAMINPAIHMLGYQYTIISNSLDADKLWNRDTIYDDIINSDVVVFPYPSPLPAYEVVKGPCRCIQSMVLGMPIIASPYPSYLTLITPGRTGLMALDNSVIGWKALLRTVGDEKFREYIGTNARKLVVEKYHVSKISESLTKTLEGIK
jgi:glycosyltransferase involved in cell wall biosynthesis